MLLLDLPEGGFDDDDDDKDGQGCPQPWLNRDRTNVGNNSYRLYGNYAESKAK